MSEKWILTIESWFLSTDICLNPREEKHVCSWSHGRLNVNAEVALGEAATLKISITKESKPRLEGEAVGVPQNGGWLFVFQLPENRPSADEFDRSIVRVTVTPDAEIRTLFANAPFGLSYMPVMRHFFEKNPARNILEWGPGRSTLMLAESLPSAEIFSVEHDPRWYERIVTLSKEYSSITPIHEPLTLQPGKSGKYVTAPLYLDKKFDLIFIDGRMRTDCIAIARQVLSENGVALVHDANRLGYHQAFGFYESAVIVNDTAVLRGARTAHR